jgi:cytochrome c553
MALAHCRFGGENTPAGGARRWRIANIKVQYGRHGGEGHHLHFVHKRASTEACGLMEKRLQLCRRCHSLVSADRVIEAMKRLLLIALTFIAALALSGGAMAATPPPTPRVVPDSMAERMKPCTICHSTEDRVGRDGYYPRIAGKPKGYLFNQLRNFRDGRRYYRPMALLLANASDPYLLEMAEHFAALKQPYPPPERIVLSPAETRLVEKLIREGDPARKIPPCVECHGKQLMGTTPFIPGLLGLPRVYMIAQLGAWKNGGLMRGRTPDCMSDVAKQLTNEEIIAVAAWLASQPVDGRMEAAESLPVEMAKRCGSTVFGGALQ